MVWYQVSPTSTTEADMAVLVPPGPATIFFFFLPRLMANQWLESL